MRNNDFICDSVNDQNINKIKDKVGEFIGKDIAAYASTKDVIRELTSSVNKSDTTISELVRGKADNIKGLSNILELMQEYIDSSCDQLSQVNVNGGSEIDVGLAKRNIKEIQRLNANVEDLTREKSQLEIKLNKALKDIAELEEFKENAKSETAGNPLSDKYVTLDINKFVNIVSPGRKKPIIKDVIYFKEIAPCRFINSFMVSLNKYMNQQLGIRCKLVIYDRKLFSNLKYGGLKVVNGGEYERIKRSAELGTVFVATEAARNIIEDLVTENEVLLIYDRLGADNDIVSGRNVHNYYVLNSLNEYVELNKIKQVDKKFIITNFGVDKHMISFPDIYEYKIMSISGKFSSYVNMPSTMDVTKSIFDVIFTDCGMTKWIESKR